MSGPGAGVAAPALRSCGPLRCFRPGRSERGSALLAVVLMTAVAIAVSASLLQGAAATISEIRARRDVLCARYAALGGLALGAPMSGAASLVSTRVGELDVWLVRMGPAWCVLRARARCERATRTLDRTLADPARCGA